MYLLSFYIDIHMGEKDQKYWADDMSGQGPIGIKIYVKVKLKTRKRNLIHDNIEIYFVFV